jgi:NAD(P)-dependent dehydrogenase (short-subunit alcohol dehydrogenase family)
MKIILTGYSQGIGKAIALDLLSKGHHVWGLARVASSEIQKDYPDQFRSSTCDVSNWINVASCAEAISGHWSSIDAIIACAGVQGEVGRTLSLDPLKWDSTIRSNLEGTFHTLRAFNFLLEKTERRGKVICFSGGGASKARPFFSAYGSAKTAIVRLVETIAEEEKDRAFDINAIAPGAINTRLLDEVLKLGPTIVGKQEYTSALKQQSEGGQSLIKTLDLVNWLLSELSDHISGKLISAQWDNWRAIKNSKMSTPEERELYTLRRKTLP